MQVGTFIPVEQPASQLKDLWVIRQTITPLFGPQFTQSRGKQQVRRLPQLPRAQRQPDGQSDPPCGAQQSNMIRLVLLQLHEPHGDDPDGQVFEPLSVQQNVLFKSVQQAELHVQAPPDWHPTGQSEPLQQASSALIGCMRKRTGATVSAEPKTVMRVKKPRLETPPRSMRSAVLETSKSELLRKSGFVIRLPPIVELTGTRALRRAPVGTHAAVQRAAPSRPVPARPPLQRRLPRARRKS